MIGDDSNNTKRRLHAPLKGIWYHMIESGIKTEEYRDINEYWVKRILKDYPIDWRFRMYVCLEINNFYMFYGKSFGGWDEIEFTLGYPKKDDMSRRMVKQVVDITIGRGRPEWGAPTDRDVFIIKFIDL